MNPSIDLPTKTTTGLFYREYGAGQPLLLLHGLMATGDMFRGVVPTLSTQHHLIVPDLRGHGRSAYLPGPYSVAHMAADAAALLDSLDLGAVDVLGYSHGGAVAQQLTLDYPSHVRRLILSNTYAHNMLTPSEHITGWLAPWMIFVLGPRGMARMMMRPGTGGGPPLPPDTAHWFVDMLASNPRGRMALAARELSIFDSRPRLKEITAPTLVITGSDDEAVPMMHPRMLADSIPGAELKVVEGAGHTLIWTHPEAFIRLVEEWLK